MQLTAVWLTPLILIPGVGLLILSTSARFAEVLGEVHRREQAGREVLDHLLRRARLFRNALVSLYLAVVLFALAGVIGCLLVTQPGVSMRVTTALTAGGIGGVILAAVELVRESLLSLAVIEEHVRRTGDR